jgi:hypothetical protein
MVYLDDILIPSKTVRERLDNLEEILHLLRREGLTLNVKKCSFLATSFGLTKAVSEFAKPQNVRQVRQLLGLTRYFRQFVKDYALIAVNKKGQKLDLGRDDGSVIHCTEGGAGASTYAGDLRRHLPDRGSHGRQITPSVVLR